LAGHYFDGSIIRRTIDINYEYAFFSSFLVTLNKIVEQSILATKLIADLAKKKSRFV
jgi:hypothetical protein